MRSVLPFRILALAAVIAATSFAAAQKQPQQNPKKYGEQLGPYATVLTESTVYVQPDAGSAKLSVIEPGREMIISEQNGNWDHVFANIEEERHTDDEPEFGRPARLPPISGWIPAQGAISDRTPNGDMILFGAAADAEEAASQPHPPQNAAKNAERLYQRMSEFFPNSTLAGEAAWRAADIQWQLDKEDISTLPSAHAKESYLRPQINEDAMRKIERTYRGTKWADLAAWDMLDNQLCGAWQGSTECPEKESAIYARYAHEHPNSPKLAQALYSAAWRQAVLKIEYEQAHQDKRAKQAEERTLDLTQAIQQKFSGTDYAARATALVYKMQHSLPVFGEDHD